MDAPQCSLRRMQETPTQAYQEAHHRFLSSAQSRMTRGKSPGGACSDVNHRSTRGGRGRTKVLGATRLPTPWAMALSKLARCGSPANMAEKSSTPSRAADVGCHIGNDIAAPIMLNQPFSHLLVRPQKWPVNCEKQWNYADVVYVCLHLSTFRCRTRCRTKSGMPIASSAGSD